jgi:hypothetical protein
MHLKVIEVLEGSFRKHQDKGPRSICNFIVEASKYLNLPKSLFIQLSQVKQFHSSRKFFTTAYEKTDNRRCVNAVRVFIGAYKDFVFVSAFTHEAIVLYVRGNVSVRVVARYVGTGMEVAISQFIQMIGSQTEWRFGIHELHEAAKFQVFRATTVVEFSVWRLVVSCDVKLCDGFIQKLI